MSLTPDRKMEKSALQKLEEMMESAKPADGIQFSFVVSPDEFPAFVHKMADLASEKDPSSFSLTWNGTTVCVKLGLE